MTPGADDDPRGPAPAGGAGRRRSDVPLGREERRQDRAARRAGALRAACGRLRADVTRARPIDHTSVAAALAWLFGHRGGRPSRALLRADLGGRSRSGSRSASAAAGRSSSRSACRSASRSPDLLVAAIGTGTWQIGVVTWRWRCSRPRSSAAAAARLPGGARSAVLVATLQPPERRRLPPRARRPDRRARPRSSSARWCCPSTRCGWSARALDPLLDRLVATLGRSPTRSSTGRPATPSWRAGRRGRGWTGARAASAIALATAGDAAAPVAEPPPSARARLDRYVVAGQSGSRSRTSRAGSRRDRALSRSKTRAPPERFRRRPGLVMRRCELERCFELGGRRARAARREAALRRGQARQRGRSTRRQPRRRFHIVRATVRWWPCEPAQSGGLPRADAQQRRPKRA